MENLDKLRILLQHWIDHNKGHAEEFEKWQYVAAHEGGASIAEHIAGAIKGMEKVNTLLKKDLEEAGGPPEGEPGHHHHH